MADASLIDTRTKGQDGPYVAELLLEKPDLVRPEAISRATAWELGAVITLLAATLDLFRLSAQPIWFDESLSIANNYSVGFPSSGSWTEVFNSDVYDNCVNPIVAGNGGGIVASDAPLHGLPASASIVIPANGLVVFTRG
jgi:hypothetical protein